jgi:predicted unusual protein kinase regulating ubiquinone biosynthesis (AarF/ABC1/UbiB family)
MVSIPVGIAGRGVLGIGKQLVGQSSSVVLADIQEKTAEQLFKVLGELKGGAMKFGQALSVLRLPFPKSLQSHTAKH